jgi:hypothetical protein
MKTTPSVLTTVSTVLGLGLEGAISGGAARAEQSPAYTWVAYYWENDTDCS